MNGIVKAFRSSLTAKLSAVIVIMIVVITTIIGSIGYILYRRDSIKSSGDRALSIALTLASVVDGDEMAHILATGEKTEHWHAVKKAADRTRLDTDTRYVYILSSDITDTVTYFLEGFDPATADTEEEYDLGYVEDAEVYNEETVTTARTGKADVSGVYDSIGYGMMLTGSAPIFDSAGRVQGVVGVDISMDQIMSSIDSFGLQTILSVVIASILFGFVSVYLIRRTVGRPIEDLTRASDRIALGDTDIDIAVRSSDEIGRLAESFRNMASSAMEQADTLEALSSGDLTVQAIPRSPQDTMGNAIVRLADQLNQIFADISQSASQVSLASGSIAQGAQMLSEGSVEQSGTIYNLADSIRTISAQVEENTRRVDEAVSLSETVIRQAEEGSAQMGRMIGAVQEIEEANRAIDGVMRIIDDIAMQTNMLALNASIEAAHAGLQGAGFAVVAEEVRNLAERSAASAREIESMIAASIEKTDLGVSLARETSQSMEKIIEGIKSSNQIVSGIADSSATQNQALQTINKSVDSVSMIVQQNTATAQQSAAASEEMSSQAVALKELISQYRFREALMS